MQIGWQNLDWKTLESLRSNYLNPSAHGVADYWKDTSHLQHYDYTFAQRIGWKWRAVIAELRQRYPTLDLKTMPKILDFACGTGIATREWLRVVPGFAGEVGLIDRSQLAMQFAKQQIQTEYPQTRAEVWDAKFQTKSWDVCLISHVTNEMGKRGVAPLTDLIKRSKLAVIVEPGTPAAGEYLRNLREAVLDTHEPLAPCTHNKVCGMIAPDRTHDWCHHFASPPREIFRDAGWTEFGKRMGIDLRSLPVSYLVLANKESMQIPARPKQQGRIIGRARVYKGYTKALYCNAGGVHDRLLQKRDDPKLYKELDKDHPFSAILSD